MLSKWLLVFLLALEVQNNSANNFIDVSKFNNVFYDPNTRLALKSTLESGSFPRVDFHGINCSCKNFTCACCSGINITRYNIDVRFCTNFTGYPESSTIKFKYVVNEKEILSTGPVSAMDPKEFCVPLYPPLFSICVHLYDIYVIGFGLHACIDFKMYVMSWPVAVLHFDCIKFGGDGITWMKPENDTYNSNALHMAGPAVIKPEVNGPEAYDSVDFESDFVEFLNSHPSSMIPEEESNIGFLKQ